MPNIFIQKALGAVVVGPFTNPLPSNYANNVSSRPFRCIVENEWWIMLFWRFGRWIKAGWGRKRVDDVAGPNGC